MKEIKRHTVFIKAGREGWFHQSVKNEGGIAVTAYREGGLFMRLLREICFRIPYLPKKVWYNKKVVLPDIDYVVVFDPLITVDYLNWLREIYPNAQLNFIYGNLIGYARHIKPKDVPTMYRLWTYDKNDAHTYGIRLHQHTSYNQSLVKPHKNNLYDVIFVGADKGRGQFVLELESNLKEYGLSTKFIIVKNGKYVRKKAYQHDPVSYSEITDLICQSRSILNVALPGQEGITVRDLEALFFGVKLITTNSNIVNTDIYHPDNVFILKDTKAKGIVDFLKTPYHQPDPQIVDNHTFDAFVDEITQSL